MRNFCRILLALVAALVGTGAASAQTNVTAAAGALKIGGYPISTGSAVFVPVNSSGQGILVTSTGGLSAPPSAQGMPPLGFSCTITAGAITGTCSVPDSATSSPSGFAYNITLLDSSTGNPTSGKYSVITQVHGVTGANWPLDHYQPASTVVTTGAFTYTQGVGAPVGTFGANSFYADITTPAAPVLYTSVNGVMVPLTSTLANNAGYNGTVGLTTPSASAFTTAKLGNDSYLPPYLPSDSDPSQTNLAATKVYADTTQIVAHREYLSHAHKILMSKSQVPLKVVFSGDSTTAGDYTTAPYRISDVVQSIANSRGISIATTNAGHSGNTTAQWLSTWLPADLAMVPDIYVIRWGLNDPYCASTCTQSAATDLSNAQLTAGELRTGLATIRASYDVTQMSLVLMMPNMTYDAPHGRTPGYYQQLFPLLRQAAIDYQATFIDTSDFLEDVGSANSTDWMHEDYPGLPYHVHPLNVMNTWIGSLVADAIFPSFYTQNVTNTYYPVAQHAAGDPPSTYEDGISIHPAANSGTTNWAYAGLVQTINQTVGASNYAVQMNWPSNANGNPAFRTWAASVGAWSSWYYPQASASGATVSAAPITLQNGWSNLGLGSATASARMDAGVVRLSGSITGGTIGAAGTLTTIATLPSALWPAANRWFTAPYLPTVNVNGSAILVVTSAGLVQIYSASGSGNYFLSLDTVSYIP